jgi:glycosyltransferase involved in cell wall biosynthesis
VFTVVYVGRLELTKGVAVLLDAVAQLPDPDLRLVLVGRFSSSSMQRFVAGRSAADPRISVTAGDPLAHLHRADALVHPSFEDGLALAPLEALATGVPVVVSEDTGMKEYVEEGKNGFVVPTGDVHALVAALRGLMDRPLTGVHERSLLPDALRGATSA